MLPSHKGRRDAAIPFRIGTGADRRQGERTLTHAVSSELYAYWNALRAGRIAPERNDVEPGAIRGVLADTFVLEFDAGIGFPFRISGSRVNALFLRELRGLSFLKLWREADRSEIESVLQRVADKAQPCLLGAEAKPPGLGSLHIEVAVLPLCHHGSTHSRILGSLASDAGPDWLGLVEVGSATLVSVKALDPAAPTTAGAATKVAASAQPATAPGGGRSLFSRSASRRRSLLV
jgi:hypothetical protein